VVMSGPSEVATKNSQIVFTEQRLQLRPVISILLFNVPPVEVAATVCCEREVYQVGMRHMLGS
jgi:hypothetical protein